MEADQRLRQRVGKFQLTKMGHFRPPLLKSRWKTIMLFRHTK